MLIRMWSDRRERNLRYARTHRIVLEEGEPSLLFALFEDDVIAIRIPTVTLRFTAG